MEIYLDVFVLLFALAALDVYIGRRDVSIFTLAAGVVLLVPFIGLRWETGNDWVPYLLYYDESNVVSIPGQELGYRWFVLLAQRAGLDYTDFLMLSAAIYMSAFAIVFARFRHPAVLLLFFYCVYLLGFMGTQRQTLAMGFTSVAMLRFYDRKFASGVALCLLGTSLHYTALISLAAIGVPRSRLSAPAFAAVLLAAVALYRFDLAGAFVERGANIAIGDGYLARRLLKYSGETELSQMTAGLSPLLELLWVLKRLVLVVVFWLFCSRKKPSLDNHLVNLYALSVALFLATYKGIPLLALRGPLYFGFFEIVLTYRALQRIGGWFRRESLLIVGGAIAAARLYAGIMLYAPALYVPYKSVLLNTDYLRFMY